MNILYDLLIGSLFFLFYLAIRSGIKGHRGIGIIIGFLFIAIGIILKGTDGELMGIGGIIIILISLIPEKDIEEDI